MGVRAYPLPLELVPKDDGLTHAQRIRWAWELATGNGADHPTGQPMSSYAVAREMGYSQPQASRFIREAKEAEPFIDLLNLPDTRLAMAHRLAKYARWIDEEAERRDRRAREESEDPTATADKTDLIKPAVMIEDRWAKLAGTDAPTRIQNETPRLHQPDPDVAVAIRDAVVESARELAAIDGRPVDDDEQENES